MDEELKKLFEELTAKFEKAEELSKEEIDMLTKLNAAQEAAKATPDPEKKKEPFRKIAFTDDHPKGVRSIREIINLPARMLSDAEKEIQRWNDDIYILSTLLKTDPRNLKSWGKLATSSSALRKAMDSATAAEGSEWVPTILSAELIEKYRMVAKVSSLFRDVAMPNNPFVYPYSAGLSASDFYFVGESTSDSPTGSPTATMATSSQTLTAKKLKARVYFSEELSEGSVVPVLPALRAEMVNAMAEVVDDIDLNGDTTSTHQDSDVTSSKDRRKAWKGLRKLCPSGTKKDLSTFSYANHRTILVAMGKYGLNTSELAIIGGPKSINKYRALSEVVTVEKYGPKAVVLNGELQKLDGISMIASEYIRENLNASGVYDGTTTSYTESIYVNKRGFRHGTWLTPKLTFKEEGETDQNQLIIRFYKAFQPVWTPSSTITTIGVAYKVS